MKQLIVIVLVLAGLYFIFDHRDPLPLNHEAIGLGVNHMAHGLFGIVLLVVAGFVWWRDRKKREQV